MRIYGINPVLEALRAGGVTEMYVSARADARLAGILRLAQDGRIPVQRIGAAELDRLAPQPTIRGLSLTSASTGGSA
jgi:tRNA G18 (ribose-2'-O)-methylase SpoU